MSMTQEQINVDLFDQVKKLQIENTRLREAIGMLNDAVHLSTGYVDEKLWNAGNDLVDGEALEKEAA